MEKIKKIVDFLISPVELILSIIYAFCSIFLVRVAARATRTGVYFKFETKFIEIRSSWAIKK